MLADVHRMLHNVRSVDFNVFDRDLSLEWQSIVSLFREQNARAKDATRNLIDTSFRKLRSAEGAFDLLHNFKKINSQGAIKEQMESKLQDILEQFLREIDNISSAFESGRCVGSLCVFVWLCCQHNVAMRCLELIWCSIYIFNLRACLLNAATHSCGAVSTLLVDTPMCTLQHACTPLCASADHSIDELRCRSNPPLTKNQPRTAGSIKWSRALFARVKQTMTKLYTMEAEMMQLDLGQAVQEKYMGLARRVLAFEKSLFSEWLNGLDGIALTYLKQTILTRDPALGHMQVNFSDGLTRLMRETRYLDRMGFDIPEVALNITLQEATYLTCALLPRCSACAPATHVIVPLGTTAGNNTACLPLHESDAEALWNISLK